MGLEQQQQEESANVVTNLSMVLVLLPSAMMTVWKKKKTLRYVVPNWVMVVTLLPRADGGAPRVVGLVF